MEKSKAEAKGFNTQTVPGWNRGEACMLKFYYDFLDRYIDRRDFELIQMDMDSNYLSISGECLEDILKPHMQAEFEMLKKQSLAWDKWSGRTPGLFKLE